MIAKNVLNSNKIEIYKISTALYAVIVIIFSIYNINGGVVELSFISLALLTGSLASASIIYIFKLPHNRISIYSTIIIGSIISLTWESLGINKTTGIDSGVIGALLSFPVNFILLKR